MIYVVFIKNTKALLPSSCTGNDDISIFRIKPNLFFFETNICNNKSRFLPSMLDNLLLKRKVDKLDQGVNMMTNNLASFEIEMERHND